MITFIFGATVTNCLILLWHVISLMLTMTFKKKKKVKLREMYLFIFEMRTFLSQRGEKCESYFDYFILCENCYISGIIWFMYCI